MMEMDTAFSEVDLRQEKMENVSEEGEKFHCDLSDKEMVHKIALVLLEGLSTTCVDNTTGDIFRNPGTVAAEIRKEMLDYLTERTQSFVAEELIVEGRPEEEISDQPSDIISDMIEDFTVLKRNLLSRVSGWLLSETRDDKIDDFVQEMDTNSFWLLDRREAVGQTLLKNVDFKNEFHCKLKFKSEVELEHHRLQCGFRTLLCENEGCSATFSAAHVEKHDSVCAFKVLPCEQKCSEILIRQEMDKHCITVCPMKPVNCPFYSIGCKANVPSCNIKQHFSDDVRSHLLLALMYHHKGASADDLKPRAERIEQESIDRLVGMQGVRSFTNAVKSLDSKLGPFTVTKKPELSEDSPASDTKISDSADSSALEPKKPDSGETLSENSDETLKTKDIQESTVEHENKPEVLETRSPKSPKPVHEEATDISGETLKTTDIQESTVEHENKPEVLKPQSPKSPKPVIEEATNISGETLKTTDIQESTVEHENKPEVLESQLPKSPVPVPEEATNISKETKIEAEVLPVEELKIAQEN